MKKIFTLILITAGLSISAQPVLLSTEMAPLGYSFYYKHVAAFTSIDTTLQGANQTWNFSTLTATNDPDFTVTIFDAAASPYVGQFPGANYGYLEGPSMDYNFFSLTSTKFERLGSYNDTDGYTTYSDPQTEFIFPFQMGVANSDSSMQTGSSWPGVYNFNCIGYGTMNLPGHTYQNVIMTHVILDNLFLIEAYYWYDSNNGQPVFAYIPGDGGFIPEAAIYLYNTTIGIDEENAAADLKINNPFTSVINAELLNKKPSAYSYQLRNSMGQIILSGVTEKNISQELNLNVENESAGLYFLVLTDLDNVENQRIIKLIKQ